MATNSLQPLYHHHSPLKRPQSDSLPSTTHSASLFLKPTITTATTSATTTTSLSFSLSSTPSSLSPPTTVASQSSLSFDLLHHHLSSQNFRQADEETRRLLIALAGEAAVKRGYVFFSEVQFISESNLKAIDELWMEHSNNRFGYSVQKRIWEKVNNDFTKFFLKVGWMKKLDTEVEQYNYRAFPTEFIWELTDETPEGHLPLTNALRGTQLLNSILTHPSFDTREEQEAEDGAGEVEEKSDNRSLKGLRDISKPLSKRVFKPDYSF